MVEAGVIETPSCPSSLEPHQLHLYLYWKGNLMSTTKICCKTCGESFDIMTKEYTRGLRKGRDPNRFFCSIRCGVIYNNKNRPPEVQAKISKHNKERMKNNKYSKKGEFSYVLRNARKRDKEFNLTDEHLQQMWEKQNGKCAYTNIDLIKPNWHTRRKPDNGSLDRIDSSKGYFANNVQWVAYSINLAKNDFPDDVFRDFLSTLLIEH